MNDILNLFFFKDSLPEWIQTVGTMWGIRMVCLCSIANFLNLTLHFLVGGFLIWLLIKRKELRKDRFFALILTGIAFSGISKFIDWYTNMLTATGTKVFFSFQLDLIIESLQFIGIGVILYGIITKLFYIHHARATNH